MSFISHDPYKYTHYIYTHDILASNINIRQTLGNLGSIYNFFLGEPCDMHHIISLSYERSNHLTIKVFVMEAR